MESTRATEFNPRGPADESSLTWQGENAAANRATGNRSHRQGSVQRTVKMTLLSGLRSYIRSSPVPMRTVLLAALLLSSLYVFTSFIGRTQLGTAASRFDWWLQAPIPFLNFFTWALLLPLVYRGSHRWSLKQRPIWKPVIAHIVVGFTFGLVHELWSNGLYIIILDQAGRIKWHWDVLRDLIYMIPSAVMQRFMEYWLLLILLMYVDTQKQIQKERSRILLLQNELQATQLLALKKQLQPHFLYNTLNTISALVDVDPRSARTVIFRLGNLLRTTLNEERRETVPLMHEVEHVENYLDIETIRFQDRLQVEYDIPFDCQNALVPSMMLQPLMENSIKHGLDATMDHVRINIEARRNNGTLMVEVRDNGFGCSDVNGALAKGGIGLRNVSERISLLYGDQGGMEIASDGGIGFRVTLFLPYTPAPQR